MSSMASLFGSPRHLGRILGAGLLALSAVPSANAAPPAPPLIETINGEQPIQVKSISISGDIANGLAETTVRMVVVNPNSRPLEGRLQFPLLDGQQVTAFSLDINGIMRAAVPVEKSKGRQVFEAIERRGVDPALMEKTAGNNFSLKIYPVPASGTRTVEFKYSEALAHDHANAVYHLPLAFGTQPLDFDLSLKVEGVAVKPEVKGMLGHVVFDKADGGVVAHVSKPQFSPSGSLDVVVPQTSGPETIVHEVNGETYFVTEVPVSREPMLRQRPLLNVIGLLWDSSGSGANRPHDAELSELDRYFHIIGRAEVRLTRLRDRPEGVETFKVVDGDWSALRQTLEGMAYDGASALADWAPQGDVTEYLLVSDGLLNYGPTKFPTLSDGVRLYTLNSGVSADTDRLSSLAEGTGGKYIQVDPQAAPGKVADELMHDAPSIANLHAEGATALLVDAVGARQGYVRIAGKLSSPSATLRFTMTEGGQSREVSVPVNASAPTHPMASRLWAMYKLHDMEAGHEAHRAEIRRIGQQFGVPTRETSLIVLERADDYVRYEIQPPAEMQAEVAQAKITFAHNVMFKREKQMDSVLRQFNEKKAWWERDYDKSDVETPPQAKQGQWAFGSMAVGSLSEVRTSAAGMPASEATTMRAAAPAPASAVPMTASSAVATNVSAMVASIPGGGNIGAAPSSDASGIGVSLKKWQSDAPYITRMKAASANDIYTVYLDEKPSYANSSAFFLDAADILMEKGKHDLALRVLSNLSEMDLENRQILRILGHRLIQAGRADLALPVFEKVLWLAEDEPQSFRDLGLVYEAVGQHQKAVDMLNEVVTRPWEGRFAEVELIALAEMNAIIATAPGGLDTSAIDPRLVKSMPLDIRVVLDWDTNDTDIDLWVTDPNGEKCFYGHKYTRQGGRMSMDYVNGYGPEEFSLRKAKPGKYKIEANFYGSRQQLVSGATTVHVRLTTGFGTPGAKDADTTIRLKSKQDTVFVGEFEVK